MVWPRIVRAYEVWNKGNVSGVRVRRLFSLNMVDIKLPSPQLSARTNPIAIMIANSCSGVNYVVWTIAK